LVSLYSTIKMMHGPINIRYALVFSVNLSETFLSLRKIQRDAIKKCPVRNVKYPLLLSDFNETWIVSTDFRKVFKWQISWKSVVWDTSSSMRTDGRTDGHDEVSSRFSQFCTHTHARTHTHTPGTYKLLFARTVICINSNDNPATPLWPLVISLNHLETTLTTSHVFVKLLDICFICEHYFTGWIHFATNATLQNIRCDVWY